MTASTAAPARPRHLVPETGLGAARLLRLELRRSAMPWILPLAAALFWLTTYRKAVAMPPLWAVRAATLHVGALLCFACPVTGVAAWMGSRDRRRRTADLIATTAQPGWARMLACWAATSCWAIAGYLACVAVLYGVTAQQATSGGPLWWPVAVGAAALPALAAAGLAAGTLAPSRFTAPVVALAAFFVIALSTQPITGGQSYWNISPVVGGPWDLGPNPGGFYPYLPDLSIVQVMFLAGFTMAVLGALALPTGPGLVAGLGRRVRRTAAAVSAAGLLMAVAAVALAGTGRMDINGMIAIPAVHDAASDLPVRYTPVCGHTAIPVCLNPAYASDLPSVAAALAPVLREVAGLPGAPIRISQAAATFGQKPGNDVVIGMAGRQVSGTPPVFRLLLPSQLPGPALSIGQVAAQVRAAAPTSIVASVVGTGSQAQRVVVAALLTAARAPEMVLLGPAGPQPAGPRRAETVHSSGPPPVVGAPAGLAPLPASLRPVMHRFAALPASVRHAWLVRHLAALRAGQVTVAELP